MYFNKRLEEYFEGLYDKFKARRHGLIEDAAEEKQSLVESEGGKQKTFQASDEKVKSTESETRFLESSGNELTASLIATGNMVTTRINMVICFIKIVFNGSMLNESSSKVLLVFSFLKFTACLYTCLGITTANMRILCF